MSKLYETLAADNIRMSVTIDGEDLMDFVKAAFIKLEEESRLRREQLDQDANMTRERSSGSMWHHIVDVGKA